MDCCRESWSIEVHLDSVVEGFEPQRMKSAAACRNTNSDTRKRRGGGVYATLEAPRSHSFGFLDVSSRLQLRWRPLLRQRGLCAKARRRGRLCVAALQCPRFMPRILIATAQVLEAFHKIIEFTQPHEPEVLRYVVTLPVDDSTGTVLYMIEECALVLALLPN